MKLLEAIEILTALINHGTEVLTTPEIYATKLGIEALKRIKDLRYKGYAETHVKLPGETPLI